MVVEGSVVVVFGGSVVVLVVVLVLVEVLVEVDVVLCAVVVVSSAG